MISPKFLNVVGLKESLDGWKLPGTESRKPHKAYFLTSCLEQALISYIWLFLNLGIKYKHTDFIDK